MTSHEQESTRILVTGARGKTGRPVVRLLQDRPGVAILAGTSRPAALDAVAAPVRPTAFDWHDRATWREATRDVDRVYLMRPDVPEAPELVAGLVELVPEAHVVLLSEQGAGELGDDHWARRVESAVTGRAASWTLLRPSWFDQMFTDPRYYRDAVRDDGLLSLPFGGGRVAWVDARDIAAVAVDALLHPHAHAGLARTITGPEALTAADVAGTLSAGLGRPVRVVEPPVAEAIAGADPWATGILRDLYDRVRRGGFAPVTSTVQAITGSPARTVRAFVRENLDAWRGADVRERAS